MFFEKQNERLHFYFGNARDRMGLAENEIVGHKIVIYAALMPIIR